MGITDLKTEGDWRWTIDESKIRFSNWSTNQPDDNNNHEDCGHFWSHRHFEWNDAPCYLDKMGYICECSKCKICYQFIMQDYINVKESWFVTIDNASVAKTTSGMALTALEKSFKSLCEHNTECDTTLFCIYGTCQCAQMHYWNGHICVSKKFNGDVCSSSIECADNMECRYAICQCPKSEYWDNSKCTSKKSVNDACMKEGECGTTLYCARNVCQCASSDYWTGSTCLISMNIKYDIVLR
ncbi:unnamed protein product [Mytilus edulis]|uniref:C-type lectin domain-containing protein n=1 Tax=Mytilus edulis TaxID=6550 RepID=A0A8S3RMP7_MYTED|nr:unnamed protein product [Mytilus edulis]